MYVAKEGVQQSKSVSASTTVGVQESKTYEHVGEANDFFQSEAEQKDRTNKFQNLIRLGTIVALVGLFTLAVGYLSNPAFISIGAFATFIGGLFWVAGLYQKAAATIAE